ncbi:MAG TPA: thioredoxin family protein [Smithella sp.]|jgi:glutaredoxin|nr:thioredoxin family protein [Smithella sp.]HOX98956.1 thioredoxin family protein [Smithella sp.]HPH55715.1 thioredoxin family protein [Smithella sp.]HPN87367.1 thioredoxin family protein [Smithella sp.]HQN71086.1 thioredoxin family protein [Smithella sp.]
MKEVKMFILEGCPHCRKAREMMTEIFSRHPEYAKVPFTVIDESINPEIADQYDYYYVPTFYTGGVKMMEGVPTKDAIEKAFSAALK